MNTRDEDFTIHRLQKHDVVQQGHFVGTSGRHLDHYVNFKRLSNYPLTMRWFARRLAGIIDAKDVKAVAGTVLGGVTLAHEVAAVLSKRTGQQILCVFLDKSSTGPILNRGQKHLIRDQEVLVLEDVVNRPVDGTLSQAIQAIRFAGAHVSQAAVGWNRGGATAETLGITNLYSLVNREFDSWSTAECAQTGPCAQGIPINTEIGHGAAFLTAQRQAVTS